VKKRSFLFYFNDSNDHRKEGGLQTAQILTVNGLFQNNFFPVFDRFYSCGKENPTDVIRWA